MLSFNACREIMPIHLRSNFVTPNHFILPNQTQPHTSCETTYKPLPSNDNESIIILRLFPRLASQATQKIRFSLEVIHTDAQSWENTALILYNTLIADQLDTNALINSLKPYLQDDSSYKCSSVSEHAFIETQEKANAMRLLSSRESNTLAIIITNYLAKMVKEKCQQQTEPNNSLLSNSNSNIQTILATDLYIRKLIIIAKILSLLASSKISKTTYEFTLINKIPCPSINALTSKRLTPLLNQDSAIQGKEKSDNHSSFLSSALLNIETCRTSSLQEILPEELDILALVQYFNKLNACSADSTHIPYITVAYSPSIQEWQIVRGNNNSIFIGLAHIEKKRWYDIHPKNNSPNTQMLGQAYESILNTLLALNNEPSSTLRNYAPITHQSIANYINQASIDPQALKESWRISIGIFITAHALSSLTKNGSLIELDIEQSLDHLIQTFEKSTELFQQLSSTDQAPLTTNKHWCITDAIDQLCMINNNCIRHIITQIIEAKANKKLITTKQIELHKRSFNNKKDIVLHQPITPCKSTSHIDGIIKKKVLLDTISIKILLEYAKSTCTEVDDYSSETIHCACIDIAWDEEGHVINEKNWRVSLMHMHKNDKDLLATINYQFKYTVRSGDIARAITTLFFPPKELNLDNTQQIQHSLEQLKWFIGIHQASHIIDKLSWKQSPDYSAIVRNFNKGKFPLAITQINKSIYAQKEEKQGIKRASDTLEEQTPLISPCKKSCHESSILATKQHIQ